MLNIYKLHGLPVTIISDRDKVFTSNLWRELFRLSQTQLCMSSAYHPQTDGQPERVKQCLETYLHCFAHACPTKWTSWLHLAEFWYNTSPHSALGNYPFKVLYRHNPRHFGIIDQASCPVPELSEWLEDIMAFSNNPCTECSSI
jgi:transposase InsO family protein